MKRSLRFLLLILLFVAIIAIRYYQTALFYDPLLAFFNSDFTNIDFPEFELTTHLISMSSRYWLNSFLSIAILYLLFPKKLIFKMSMVIYLLIFLVSILLYYYFIQTEFKLGFTAGFYIRRILMQPLTLLLLIPAFWYTEKKQ